MSAESKRSPPYIGFNSFVAFANRLRDTAIPDRIDRSVFGNVSGGMAYGILSGLKFLKLVDETGRPSEIFQSFISAQDGDRPEILRNILEKGFAEIFSSNVKLSSATSGQFDELLRDSYDIKDSTVDKAAAFFLTAAEQAGLTVSHHLKNRKPLSSPAARKANKPKKEPQGAPERPVPPPSNQDSSAQSDPVSTLVSIIDMNEMNDDEQSAVWTLIRYLKRREAAQKKVGGGSND